jgi:carbon-monoxide dehydrogenase medium subunit
MPKLAEYHRPATLEEALALLRREKIRTVPLAGGTSLVPTLGRRAKAVVDLQALKLDTLALEGNRLHVGAMVRLQQLVEAPEAGPFLAGAAHAEGPHNLRNAATVGGTVAEADPLSELLIALLVLDAEVNLRLPDPTTVSLDRLLDSPGQMLDGGLISAVTALAPVAAPMVAMERVARTPKDRPIVAVAARLERSGDLCSGAYLALAGVAGRPICLPKVEDKLKGQPFGAELAELAAAAVADAIEPTSDFRASGEYRREMAVVLIRRALLAAMGG